MRYREGGYLWCHNGASLGTTLQGVAYERWQIHLVILTGQLAYSQLAILATRLRLLSVLAEPYARITGVSLRLTAS